MKYILYLALSLCLFQIGCKNSKDGSDAETQALEKAFNAEANETNYSKLIEKYLALIQDANKDKKALEALLVKAAAASEKMGNHKQLVVFLNNLVRNFYKRGDTPDNIYKMISSLKQINKSTAADVMTLCFTKAFPDHPKAVELKANLPAISNPEEYILEVGKAIFSDTVKGFSEEKAYIYVDACEAYGIILPDDPQTPEYLFKAAETSKILKTYEKSFSLFDWIIEKYPNHPRAESSAFMKGFMFDSELNDTANARKYYNEFIHKYPKSDFVDDAQYLISNIGKSEEQILEELKAKSQNQ